MAHRPFTAVAVTEVSSLISLNKVAKFRKLLHTLASIRTPHSYGWKKVTMKNGQLKPDYDVQMLNQKSVCCVQHTYQIPQIHATSFHT